jgi:hypothetical protein
MKLPRPQITKGRIRLARSIAVSADAMQLGFFPVFAAGFVSVLDIILDVAVCVLLSLLLGFRMWFLPSFLFEGLPLIDLAPTWTIAVFLATRGGVDVPPVIELYEKKN